MSREVRALIKSQGVLCDHRMLLNALIGIKMLAVDHLVLLDKQVFEFEPLLYLLTWRTFTHGLIAEL